MEDVGRIEYGTRRSQEFIAKRESAKPGAGFYTGPELRGLEIAQIDDEIDSIEEYLTRLRRRRDAIDAGEDGEVWRP
jgi:hypothetical protein